MQQPLRPRDRPFRFRSARPERVGLLDADVLALPLVTALAALVIVLSDSNVELFRLLNRVGPATCDTCWMHVTVLGDGLVCLVLCLPLWRLRPRLMTAVLAGTLLSYAFVHGLKPLFDLPRPPAVLAQLHVIGPAHRSDAFPSGHATTIFVVASFYALGLRRLWVTLAAIAIAAVVAASRVVVGVHWPLDVLAGAGGGWLVGAVSLAATQSPAGTGSPRVQVATGVALLVCALALVLGHDTGYPAAAGFVRAIGVAALLFAMYGLWRQRPTRGRRAPPG